MNIKHTERQRGPRQQEDLASAKYTPAESGEAEISRYLKYENFLMKKNILHLSMRFKANALNLTLFSWIQSLQI